MKREDISRAVGDIDTAYIEEAAEEPDQKKMGKPWMKRVLPIAACVTLVLTSAWFLWQRVPLGQAGAAAQDSLCGSIGDCQENTDMSPDSGTDGAAPETDNTSKDQAASQTVQFNDAHLRPVAGGEIELLAEDFVPMSREELLTYFDTTLPISQMLPELRPLSPSQMDLWPYGLYRRNGGEIYHDQTIFPFANSDGSKQVQIQLSKVRHMAGVVPELREDGVLHRTAVNGRELTVFRDRDSGVLYVEWLQNGVGWRVWAAGLTEETFYQLLVGLVEPMDPRPTQTLSGQVFGIDPRAHTVWVVPEDGSGMMVELPADCSMEKIQMYDRVQVIWQGEPATLQTVWKEQLTEFTVLKGE